MTSKDEALKLALEALELAKRSHGMMLLSDPPQEAWKTYRVDDSLNRAITVLREALAEQPAQRTWVNATTWRGLTDEEVEQGLLRSDYALQTAHAWRSGVVFAMAKLKEKNT